MDIQMPLPRLREDLRLTDGPPLADGSPTWTLHDPVRHRFFRIGWLEFELLSRWSAQDPERLVEQVNAETRLEATPTEVAALTQFLLTHRLVAPDDPRAAQRLRSDLGRARPGPWGWLLRHYLYIRIPLIRPDRVLTQLLPLARRLGSRPALVLYAAVALLGLVLAGRQWGSFVHTFPHFFNPMGIAVYVAAIFTAKVVHELGHAFAAKHYGLRVPTMGVAFLVLWPMLYTDNTEAWKLRCRSQRMAIVAAGALAELALAAMATLCWSLLPDGPLRSACFVLATVTWIGSLVLNLSPFMRFDGYYLLADFLDVPNLQDRAFALGRWYLRRGILGIDDPPPERFSPGRQRVLILYAFATWIYRVLVLTAIALMVYHLFFKALGVLLFGVEITWFVVGPIGREMAAWWRLKGRLKPNRRLVAALVLLVAGAGALLFPWSHGVSLPALVRPAYARIYPPFSARIVSVAVHEGQWVQAGTVLYRFDSPEIGHRLERAQAQVRALQLQLMRQGSASELMAQHRTTEEQLAEALTQAQGYRRRIDQLIVTTPMPGRIMDMADGLRPGRWVHGSQLLAVVVDTGQVRVGALAQETELAAVATGQPARFYFEGAAFAPVDCRLERIDRAAVRTLAEPYLASIYGGDLPVHRTDHGLRPHASVYGISLRICDSPRLPERMLRGTVRVQGRPQSLLGRLLRNAYALLIRESGF
ncbi:MAG: HlyD family efflux transporter periplasmic adaptor subunit [Desulfatibacillum sp.]|nr:HlyD family efflux transporter periplasmic adaptor subunit [Desulfatibacillum sp.]